MKKASDYRKHAQECRALAKRMEHGEQRDQLLAMAETWDRLAEQREILPPGEPGSADPDTAGRAPFAPRSSQRH